MSRLFSRILGELNRSYLTSVEEELPVFGFAFISGDFTGDSLRFRIDRSQALVEENVVSFFGQNKELTDFQLWKRLNEFNQKPKWSANPESKSWYSHLHWQLLLRFGRGLEPFLLLLKTASDQVRSDWRTRELRSTAFDSQRLDLTSSQRSESFDAFSGALLSSSGGGNFFSRIKWLSHYLAQFPKNNTLESSLVFFNISILRHQGRRRHCQPEQQSCPTSKFIRRNDFVELESRLFGNPAASQLRKVLDRKLDRKSSKARVKVAAMACKDLQKVQWTLVIL